MLFRPGAFGKGRIGRICRGRPWNFDKSACCFSSFWKIQHVDLDGQPDLWGIKALEREVLLVENIELRNRISRRTAHSGFCFLLFWGASLETKDSSPSYHDQTFSLRVYPYFTVVPRGPRCPFLAAMTSPTGLARGQSTQWHSATEGHFRWFVAVERVHWIYWIT